MNLEMTPVTRHAWRRWCRTAAGPAIALAGLLCALPSPARAQGVDLAVEAVETSPATVRPGETLTIAATVRRLDAPKTSAAPVDVLVEFWRAGVATPFARRPASLAPGGTAVVRAPWTAVEGKHEFRVRIGPVTQKGQVVKDTNSQNDERRSAPVTVAAAPPPPAPGGAPAPAAGPRGPVTLTTGALSMIGSPEAPPPPPGPFSPVTLTTDALSMIGSPEAPPPPPGPFSPVTVATDALSMIGAP